MAQLQVAAAAAAASAAKGNRPSGGLNPSFKFEADSGIESAWDFSMAKVFFFFLPWFLKHVHRALLQAATVEAPV